MLDRSSDCPLAQPAERKSGSNLSGVKLRGEGARGTLRKREFGRSLAAFALVGLLLTAVSAGIPTGGGLGAMAGTASCKPWRSVPSSSLDGQLEDASGTSPSDVWAVGYETGVPTPVIGHWDGAAWSNVPQPAENSDLYAVAAVSPVDAWAVGVTFTGEADYSTTLIEHWDGSAWSVEAAPSPGTNDRLYSVSTVDPDDIWAVGHYTDSQTYIHALALHWNGSAWTAVPAPDASRYLTLFYGVAAQSTDDVWAVGYKQTRPGVGSFQPIAEHWDGTKWSLVDTPILPGSVDIFYDVSGVSSNDVWAVGVYQPSGPEHSSPLVEHWDGSSWRLVPAPEQPNVEYSLLDVYATASNDVWAVGISWKDLPTEHPVAEHWNGTRWSLSSVRVHGESGGFFGVVVTLATDIWAVGFVQSNGESGTLTEHSRGTCRS
jgi:hypothetical protein